MDEHASSSRSFGDDKLIYTFLRGDAVWWVEENVLIDRLMKDRNKNLHDFKEMHQLQLVIDASFLEPNNFLLNKENKSYDAETKKPDLINSSKKLISINPDKGSELLNGWYFWGKYMSEVFPPLTTIATTIITTILTSGAIWLFLLKFFL